MSQRPPKSEEPAQQASKTAKKSWTWIPTRPLLLAALPVALTVFYLTTVAPKLIPVPEGVRVPSQLATHYLEIAVAWCAEHQLYAYLIGGALLLPGLIFHFFGTAARYYLRLSILVLLALGFTYLSISAPIDRLLYAIENAVPSDNRVPEANRR